MLLKSIPQHQNVPKEYDLEVNKEDARNTFIFSEQDLPGYAAKNKAKADAIKAGIPAYLMKSKNEKENTATSWERRKKGGVPPRKSIPKKTAIAGKVRHLVTGIPVENIETEMITRREREEAMKPKAETDIVEALAIDPRRVLQAGTEDVTNFIVRHSHSLTHVYVLTPNYRRRPRHPNQRGTTTRRPACPRTSCSMRSTPASASTTSGR